MIEVLQGRADAGALPGSLESLRLGKPLGRGGFALVFQGTIRPCEESIAGRLGDVKVAVKILHDFYGEDGSQELRLFREEASLMLQLAHPNIITAYGLVKLQPTFPGLAGYSRPAYALILELMEGGSLAGLMVKQLLAGGVAKYTFGQALGWATDVARALQYLHAGGRDGFPRIHRDVKLENVLLSGDTSCAKLADFGLQRAIATQQDQQGPILVRRSQRGSAPTPRPASVGVSRLGGAAAAPASLEPCSPRLSSMAGTSAMRPSTAGSRPGSGAAPAAAAVGDGAAGGEPEAVPESPPDQPVFYALGDEGLTPLANMEPTSPHSTQPASPFTGPPAAGGDKWVPVPLPPMPAAQPNSVGPSAPPPDASSPASGAGPVLTTSTRPIPASRLGASAYGLSVNGPSRPSPLGLPSSRGEQQLPTQGASAGASPRDAMPSRFSSDVLSGSAAAAPTASSLPSGSRPSPRLGSAGRQQLAAPGGSLDARAAEVRASRASAGEVPLGSQGAASPTRDCRTASGPGPTASLATRQPSSRFRSAASESSAVLECDITINVAGPGAQALSIGAGDDILNAPQSARQTAAGLAGEAPPVGCAAGQLLPGSSQRLVSSDTGGSYLPPSVAVGRESSPASQMQTKEDVAAATATQTASLSACGAEASGARLAKGAPALAAGGAADADDRVASAPLARLQLTELLNMRLGNGSVSVRSVRNSASGALTARAAMGSAPSSPRLAAIAAAARAAGSAAGAGAGLEAGGGGSAVARRTQSLTGDAGRRGAAGLPLPENDFEEVFSLTGRTGSMVYIAPEAYKNEPYNDKVDVYSLAILMYELFGRTSITYTHISTKLPAFSRMLCNADEFAERAAAGYRPPRPNTMDRLPPELWELIQAAWHQDPIQRPDIDGLVEALECVAESLAAMEAGRRGGAAAGAAAKMGCGCVVC